MTIANRWRSLKIRLLINARRLRLMRALHELKRRLLRRRHVVSVFLQIDDPYSYLLSHYLPSLANEFDVKLQLYLSEAHGGAYQPSPDLLAEYAVRDCRRLAAEIGIAFLDKGNLPPSEYRAGLSDAVAATVGDAGFNDELMQALQVFWRGDSAAAARMSHSAGAAGQATEVIANSQQRQLALGHYNSAMLHYAGEWYWGVDRLHYLLERLRELGAAKHDASGATLASIKQAMQVSLPVRPPSAAKDLPAIEYFHSPRSPYSYLALRRVIEIADAFGLALQIRPVLPMVMRGMQVPTAKLKYIVRDANREALRKNIEFGYVSDPVGAATERILAVFRFAEQEHREREFLVNAGIAIWAEGIDVATDKGMRKVTGRSGLFWPGVLAAMKTDDWRETVDANRESMMNAGSWGVPTIRMGDYVIWGQDRDWMLVRRIEELCDSGDGILV